MRQVRTTSGALAILAHLGWIAVGLFWFFMTRNFHPTTTLAVIVTVSLVTAFVVAADVDYFLLVPRFARKRRYLAYGYSLFGTMALVTAVALVVIRISYFHLFGPDADPYGAYKHYLIDLFGVAVHVVFAWGVVWVWGMVAEKGI